MSQINFLWHNSMILPDDALVFKASDRIRLGDGVFDTMLCIDGVAQHCALHFQRLQKGADLMGIPLAMDVAEYESAISDLIAHNNADKGHYVLNTLISRGPGLRGLAIDENCSATQMIIRLTVLPATNIMPPVHGFIAQNVRRNEGSPLSRIKSFNYGDNILALREVTLRGGTEAVMLNNAGHITCTSAGNIFMVDGSGKIFTPPLSDGALDGIARHLFIRSHTVVERSFTADDLALAQSVFLTNSIRGAVFFDTLEGRKLSPSSLDIHTKFHIL